MELYILRHGEAEQTQPDADRKLTPKGKRDVRRIIEAARKSIDPQLILTSPLRRAQETAAIAAASLGNCPVATTDHLRPEATPASIWKQVSANRKIARILLTGHEPHLSNTIAYLLNAPVAVNLRKSALVRIDFETRKTPPQGVLQWIITPRLASAK